MKMDHKKFIELQFAKANYELKNLEAQNRIDHAVFTEKHSMLCKQIRALEKHLEEHKGE